MGWGHTVLGSLIDAVTAGLEFDFAALLKRGKLRVGGVDGEGGEADCRGYHLGVSWRSMWLEVVHLRGMGGVRRATHVRRWSLQGDIVADLDGYRFEGGIRCCEYSREMEDKLGALVVDRV